MGMKPAFATLALLLPALMADGAEAPRLLQGRYALSAAVVEDRLYVFGGQAAAGISRNVEAVNLLTGASESLGDLAAARRYGTAEGLDGKVYLFGGEDDDDYVNAVEVFDPATRSVKTLAPLPRPRRTAASAVLNGRIYVIGGHIGSERLPYVDIYDPAADSWSEGADMPTARECEVVAHGERLYAIGGFDGRESLPAFEVYDPVADRWEKLPDLPFPISAHHAAVFEDSLYTFGDYKRLERVASYSFADGRWSILDPHTYYPSRHNAVVQRGDSAYVIGGNVRSAGSHMDRIQVFDRAALETNPRRDFDEEQDGRPTAPDLLVDPAVLKVAEAIGGRLDGIDTLRRTLVTRIDRFSGGETNTHAYTTTVVLTRSNKFRREEPHMVVASDGVNLTARYAPRRRYWRGPLDTSDAWAMAMARPLVAHPLSMENLVASSNSVEAARQALSQISIAEAVEDDLDGEPCWRLRYTTGVGSRHETRTTLYISQKDGLALRTETMTGHAVPSVGESDGDASAVSTRIAMTTLPVATEINGPVREEEFALQPAPGDREVDAIGKLYGVSSSSGPRFSLSGKPAPDFDLKLLDGSTFELSAQTGKVVVLDFWATWCGPCVKALPHMKGLAESMAGKDVVVVGVSRDREDDVEKVRKMVEKHELPYAVGIDVSEIGAAYDVNAIPCLVLVDRKGIVQGRQVGFSSTAKEQLAGDIEKLLAGEDLPGSKPMTEEEIREAEEAASSGMGRATEFPTNYFRKVWSAAVKGRPYAGIHSVERAVVRLPPRHVASVTQREFRFLDAATGDAVLSASLPEDFVGTGPMPGRVHAAYLRHASGDKVVLVKPRLVETKTEDGRKAYRHSGGQAVALDREGNRAWEIDWDENFSPMVVEALPVGPSEDWLIVKSWNEMRFIDATGRALLSLREDHSSHIEFTDLEGDGTIDVLVTGPQSSLYRLDPTAGNPSP